MMDKGAVMEKRRAWTARGVMTEDDKAIVRAVAKNSSFAARVFVTGESHASYLGETAVQLLEGINDTLYKNNAGQEPLFVHTRDNTVRMLRFEPGVAWRCIHPDLFIELVKQESDRLHVDVDPHKMDIFDFYGEMARTIRIQTSEHSLPIAWKDSGIDDYYNAIYLSCLLIFGKPGYLDVPVAQWFAQPKVADWMAGVDYRLLTAPEIGKFMELETLYGGIQGLTNPELHFIVDLYQRSKSGSSAAPTFEEDKKL